MSIERERYEQMMQRRTGWDRIRAWFVFPPLPRQEPPANAPSGGPIEAPPARPDPSNDQIQAVALDLMNALGDPRCLRRGFIEERLRQKHEAPMLTVDGVVDMTALAIAAITAVRSHGL